MNKEEKVILPDSPEAAQRVTITAWRSASGYTFFDEYSARYNGSTHRLCTDCEKVIERGHLVCNACQDLRDKAKYDSMPKAVWDENGMIYSDMADRYYSSIEEAIDDLDEDETVEDLRLIICEPIFAHGLEPDDFVDELPEDGDVPDWLHEAIEAFNKSVKEGGPLSYSPGKTAVDLSVYETGDLR